MLMITDFTVNGNCSNCGECCSNCLPMSESDVKRIKAYIQKHGIKEQRHNFAVGVDMTCPFRDEANRKCLIYDIRPEICRSFLCNRPQEELLKEKTAIHKRQRTVFMRSEFFGNTEDFDFFASVMRSTVGR